jgi:tRNA G18 (ribose-2'-O)-methylase SpoU
VIHHIESPDDARLEVYRHVGDPGCLRERGLFVAEGRLVVERLVEGSRFPVQSIAVTPAARAALAHALDRVQSDVLVVSQATLNGITGFDFHRGCLAIAHRPDALAVESLLGARLLLGLEAVSNPDNVGGLFRSAAAFGVGGVLLDHASGDPLYRKAIRTSMAATLSVPFATIPDWAAVVPRLRQQGLSVVALTPHQDAASLYDVAPSMMNQPVLLLVGAEGAGLSQATLAIADMRARIPMASGVDSLNVTVAAGIALSVLAALR